MIVFGLLSSVSDILTFITLRLGFHASATLFAAVGSSNRPSPNSPSRSSCAPVGPSAWFEPDVRYTSTDLQIYLRLVGRGLVREAACHLSLAGHRRLPAPGRPARASPWPILSRQAKITRLRG